MEKANAAERIEVIEEKREGRRNAKPETIQTVGRFVHDTILDNGFPTKYNDRGQHAEGYRKELQRTVQDEKIGELFLRKMEYVSTRRIYMKNLQKTHRARTNDG